MRYCFWTLHTDCAGKMKLQLCRGGIIHASTEDYNASPGMQRMVSLSNTCGCRFWDQVIPWAFLHEVQRNSGMQRIDSDLQELLASVLKSRSL